MLWCLFHVRLCLVSVQSAGALPDPQEGLTWCPRVGLQAECSISFSSLTPCFPGQRVAQMDALAGPILGGQARCQDSLWTQVLPRGPDSSLDLPPRLFPLQQSYPEGLLPGALCHRSQPPPTLGTVSWARLRMAFTPESHVCRRQVTQFKIALCLDF